MPKQLKFLSNNPKSIKEITSLSNNYSNLNGINI